MFLDVRTALQDLFDRALDIRKTGNLPCRSILSKQEATTFAPSVRATCSFARVVPSGRDLRQPVSGAFRFYDIAVCMALDSPILRSYHESTFSPLSWGGRGAVEMVHSWPLAGGNL